jgi:hypothetical protein
METAPVPGSICHRGTGNWLSSNSDHGSGAKLLRLQYDRINRHDAKDPVADEELVAVLSSVFCLAQRKSPGRLAWG